MWPMNEIEEKRRKMSNQPIAEVLDVLIQSAQEMAKLYNEFREMSIKEFGYDDKDLSAGSASVYWCSKSNKYKAHIANIKKIHAWTLAHKDDKEVQAGVEVHEVHGKKLIIHTAYKHCKPSLLKSKHIVRFVVGYAHRWLHPQTAYRQFDSNRPFTFVPYENLKEIPIYALVKGGPIDKTFELHVDTYEGKQLHLTMYLNRPHDMQLHDELQSNTHHAFFMDLCNGASKSKKGSRIITKRFPDMLCDCCE